MKNLFGYVMVGLAFTVLQVSTASAQVMSSEQEQMITSNDVKLTENDASAGQDGIEERTEERSESRQHGCGQYDICK